MNKIILVGHAEHDDYYVDSCKIIDAFFRIERLQVLPVDLKKARPIDLVFVHGKPVDLNKVTVISSTLLHGKPSAKIIADGLGLDEDKIYLKRWLSNPRIVSQQLEKLIIKHPKIEIIITVTRTTEIEKILDYFGKNLRIGGVWPGNRWFVVEDGDAFLIDLDARKIREL